MGAFAFDRLGAEVRATRMVRDVGRVAEVGTTTITVSGLLKVASLGDQVRWMSSDWQTMTGEIVRIGANGAIVLMAGSTEGISIGNRVQHLGACEVSPDDQWLGRRIHAALAHVHLPKQPR